MTDPSKHRHDAIRRLDKAADQAVPLLAQGSWPATTYLLEPKAADAIIAALTAGRPLLVRGEPGVGKSQLARAAAALLERPFLPEVIQPDSEYTDLLWRVDHTKRLADAQLLGQGENGGLSREHVSEIGHYIGPGALWWALNPGDAQTQHRRGAPNYLLPDDILVKDCQERGVVLLIDEVDKADINLTNGLLEVLGNGGFDIPPIGHTVGCVGVPPLVVLTSNDTRELPAALLRRCVVLTLSLGKDVAGHLRKIAATVFPDMDENVLAEAAMQIVNDRKTCRDGPKTGLAEYLDLLRALDDLSARGDDPLAWLERLGHYFHKSQIGRGVDADDA